MNELRSLVAKEVAATRAGALDGALRERAERSRAVDVSIAATDSPIGELFLAVTRRGLLHIGYSEEDHEATLRDIAGKVSPRILAAVRAADEARRELEEYFAGRRTSFSLRLDRRLMSPFAREVLAATAEVPFGSVTTYGEVATRIHRPQAARAVGAALGSNPIPIVVPCHRVVGADGALTGYAGGLDRKVFLLQLEGQPPLGMFG
jgi:methylated-DNA-[protein]-cysteine S-methyltransferase